MLILFTNVNLLHSSKTLIILIQFLKKAMNGNMGEMNSSISNFYSSIEQILATAKKANHHRIGEFNINNRNLGKNAKGSIGQIVEEGIFHYQLNSKAEADFSNLGVELKVTGLKILKNHRLAMKERLVLNIINYFKEANVDFEHSSFWHKNKLLLIMFYLYEYERNDSNYMILESVLHKFLPKDLEIIKEDWKIIHDKIVNGEAHNISEADTMYLGACTKGADSASSYREQPNSSIKARQRAYCLKASYMNSFVDKIFENKTYEEIVNYEEIKGHSFEYLVNARLAEYYGKTEKELLNKFGINPTAKARFHLLCAKMLGINGSINDSDEFKKANIELKTIRIEENGLIREHMSFPHFVYKEIIGQKWEDSDIFNKFYSTKFLFVIFKKENGEYRLNKVKLWNMPYQDIEKYVKPVFEQTKEIIAHGEIVKEVKNGKYFTNFLGSSFNGVCHVRPHDQKGIDKTQKGLELPISDKLTGLNRYTKQCFWLDKDYILKQVK